LNSLGSRWYSCFNTCRYSLSRVGCKCSKAVAFNVCRTALSHWCYGGPIEEEHGRGSAVELSLSPGLRGGGWRLQKGGKTIRTSSSSSRSAWAASERCSASMASSGRLAPPAAVASVCFRA
jgi:hypothetical protein